MADGIERLNELRREVKVVADHVSDLRRGVFSYGLDGLPSEAAVGEAMANVTLAYRHLEDASMRLGKAIQALDGGVSVYDKATTVGA